jgi:GntR family galactonate operon transcriptional repressor
MMIPMNTDLDYASGPVGAAAGEPIPKDGSSRTEALTSVLLDKIIGGVYAPGASIPTEAQIGATFGVSRTVVRETVKVLEEKQLVRIDRGRGTTVLPRSEWRVLDSANLSSRIRHGDRENVIRELILVRKGLEPELAATTARLVDAQGVAMLGSRVETLRQTLGDDERYRVADGAFHEAIAEAAGVAIAIEFLRVMREPLSLSRRLTDQIPDARMSAHEHHLEIFAAIAAHDPEAARDAMRRHLVWAEDRLTLALAPEDER